MIVEIAISSRVRYNFQQFSNTNFSMSNFMCYKENLRYIALSK